MKAKLQMKLVHDWNQKNKEGCAVNVRLDNGAVRKTITMGEAFMLAGHTAVVMLQGISGCYALTRCTAAALALLLATGCATSKPQSACVGVRFDHVPSASTQAALTATTTSSPAEIAAWFTHDRTFTINTTNLVAATNAIAAAQAEGATIINHQKN
jgi:hypothetical protein